MRLSRIYQSLTLKPGQLLQLDKRASHYIATVLRLKTKSQICLFNGAGQECLATVTEVNRNNVYVTLNTQVTPIPEPTLQLHLGQALLRNEKMDLVIQKAVELGVTQITPLLTRYVNVKLPAQRCEKRLEHWKNLIISACEQCGRSTLPTISKPEAYGTWLTQHQDSSCFILHPGGNSKDVFKNAEQAITLAIGPEGGFDDDELQQAQQVGFQQTTLGPRVLRTETAALVSLSILQYQFGDM